MNKWNKNLRCKQCIPQFRFWGDFESNRHTSNGNNSFQVYIIPYRNYLFGTFVPQSLCIRRKIDKYRPCHAVSAIIYLGNMIASDIEISG